MKPLYWLGWLLARATATIAFRARVSGREHLPPTGGFVLASNHISYADPPFLGCMVPRQLFFFAKRELFDHRLLGALFRSVNAMPVTRGTVDRREVREAIKVVKQGYGLVVFPEGTRSKSGVLRSPRPGMALIARQTACPITPAYVYGANRLKRCLWGRGRLGIVFGEPIPAEWILSRPAGRDGSLEIARAVMDRIQRLRQGVEGGQVVKVQRSTSE